ncbi:MAG: 3'(2'),5'-bisphosphate nucleotidase CysQ [Xanthomonadaceae bacterium]|jgi:3'(2'), 5'-bisphosphate nucleotidase|nr:3'(2'),5'-bisphosphate nucleotidase CysQ [Xanthomonadaceae bacterium]
MMEMAGLREAVIDIACEAGTAIMSVYRGEFEVERKSDASPVTAADLASQRVIADALRRLTPDLPVLSEEGVQAPWEIRRYWPRYWLVDPLDGTREFVNRNDEFSVNIALIDQGVPVLGVIQSPVTGIIWHAVSAHGACLRDGARERELRVRKPAVPPLRIAVSRSRPPPRTQALMAVIEDGTLPVALGSSLKFCRIAAGELDVYPRLGPTSEWDTAAGQCILETAGGVLLSPRTGRPFRYNQKESLINGDFIALGDGSLPWRRWFEDSGWTETPSV